MPDSLAISVSGFSSALRAISKSEGKGIFIPR